jgi:hypothetical protein
MLFTTGFIHMGHEHTHTCVHLGVEDRVKTMPLIIFVVVRSTVRDPMGLYEAMHTIGLNPSGSSFAPESRSDRV